MAPFTAQDKAIIEQLVKDGSTAKDIWLLWRVDHAYTGSFAAVKRIATDVKRYGTSLDAPRGKPGRPKKILPHIRDFIVDVIAAKGTTWVDELQEHIVVQFGVYIGCTAIKECLKSIKMTNKVVQRQASQRNKEAELVYLLNIEHWTAKQIVFVDKTYCSKKSAVRRRGWAPKGFPCITKDHLHRPQRYSVLPAYTVDG